MQCIEDAFTQCEAFREGLESFRFRVDYYVMINTKVNLVDLTYLDVIDFPFVDINRLP